MYLGHGHVYIVMVCDIYGCAWSVYFHSVYFPSHGYARCNIVYYRRPYSTQVLCERRCWRQGPRWWRASPRKSFQHSCCCVCISLPIHRCYHYFLWYWAQGRGTEGGMCYFCFTQFGALFCSILSHFEKMDFGFLVLFVPLVVVPFFYLVLLFVYQFDSIFVPLFLENVCQIFVQTIFQLCFQQRRGGRGPFEPNQNGHSLQQAHIPPRETRM